MSRLVSRLWRLLLLVAVPLAATAQTPSSSTSARLAGVVTDAASGQPLAGATVRLVDRERGAVADRDGRFEIGGLASGAAMLRVTSVGYAADERAVTLASGETLRVDIALAPEATDLDVVTVTGRGTNLVGRARTASQGLVGQAQLELRPLLRVGEVLETIPGAIVTQHSGSGKANQFFLRGFNLDHGTDFSASLEGVPMNLPTHAHGQGYLDLNSLIPELIEEVAFEKGPQNAAAGDFSTAGRAEIRLVDRLDRGIARAETGLDNMAGALIANSHRVGGADLLYGVRASYTDGPWVNPENGTLVSAVAKASTGTRARGLSLTALAYHTDWDATDQIASRAVPTVSRLGSLDPTNGGTTGRYTLVGTWRTASASGAARTRATAYGSYYHLDLYSNFTYFLDDPVDGDQFEQADRRVYGGASMEHDRLVGDRHLVTVGTDLRHDEILQVGLFRTRNRQRLGTVRDDDVSQSRLGAYAQAESRWTPWARTTLGLRGDLYRFDVRSDLGVNSGTETDAIASPKVGLVLGPWRETEVYLNAGLGFHSNDARGTTIAVDPASGEAVDRVDPLVRTRGAEAGVRSAVLPGVQATAALWTLALDSELVFVGDAGGTEASDASRHTGVEVTTFVEATDWLDLTLDVALTRSRFTEGDPDADRIENSIGRVVSGGVYAGRETGPLAAVQLRHFGPRPLTGDGSVTAPAATLLHAKVGYRTGALGLSLDLLNALDSQAADVSYFYASRLPGEAAAGVEDVHFHPVQPRTVRLTALVRF
ncbi:MAG: TonB-dependent receptor [Bacteroidota bacterium]